MRYDTKVIFWNEGQSKYNPVTHKHEIKAKKVSINFCNVTDLGTSMQVELLGALKEGSKTIRMLVLPDFKYDYITVENDSHKYRFVSSLKVLKGYAMIVGRDNG